MAKNIFYANFFNFFETGYPLLFIESKKTTEVYCTPKVRHKKSNFWGVF